MTRGAAQWCVAGAVVMLAAGCSSSRDAAPATPANVAPTVRAPAAQAVNQDTVVGPLSFTIADDLTDVSALVVRAESSDGMVVANEDITLSGAGATRMIQLRPREASTGTTTITLSATDAAGLMTRSTFGVTFNSVPASLSLSAQAAFAKGENDTPDAVNGFTFSEDADVSLDGLLQ